MADMPGQFRLDTVAGRGSDSLYKWTLTTDMGQLIATSETFPDKASAERVIQWVKDNAASCEILPVPYRGPAIG